MKQATIDKLKTILERALETVSARERQVLKLHYGLKDGQCYEVDEIAEKLNLPIDRVAEILESGVRRLETEGGREILEDFLGDA